MDEQELQEDRPRVELQFTDEEGRGQFFILPGTQPEAGFVPDIARVGSMELLLITKADFTEHSKFVGKIRRQFYQMAKALNAILNTKFFLQNVTSLQTTPGIHPEEGAFYSNLKFSYRYSFKPIYRCDDSLGDLLGTVTPLISAATPIAQFGNFEAGNYKVVYRTGAMKYNGGSNFQINRTADDHEFKVIHSQGVGLFTAPGNSQQYFAEVDCVAANAGAESATFAHAGGQIGVYLQDAPYNDNIGGNQNPTFELYRVITTCGFVDQTVEI